MDVKVGSARVALIRPHLRDRERASAGCDRHSSVVIGAIHARAEALERFDRRQSGMAEHVMAADGNERVLRMYGGDKRRAAAVRAAMMPHLEHVCMQIDSFVQKALLGRDAGIAGKQHAEVLVLQDKRDRVVVDRIVAFDERQRWPDEPECYAVFRAPNIPARG